ncbi:LysR family transcriptional regulator [Methyloraptor flagellatus]|uniref:LysR substrate-binding domain-containing protein n=1 Tax=Methyloraptor flagellatus TaxID=3162530 RepID=A0AAU7XHD7_9HYPH
MTLEQLRIFIAVAEAEHLTRAAAVLRLTPSAVSSAIRALETRHDVRLFDRPAGRIVLTDLGRAFLDDARAVLAEARRAELRLAELAGRIAGALRIEASQTISAYWLPARIVAFRTAHPDVAVELAIGNTEAVARAVAEGTADLGFVEGEVRGEGLSVRTVARDRLMIVGSAARHTGPEAPLALEALVGRTWVLRERGSGTRSEFEAAIRRGGDPKALDVALELPSNEAVMAAVAAGAGVTAVSALAAAGAIASGRLVALDSFFAERPFQMLRNADRTPTGAATAFMALVDRYRSEAERLADADT